MENELSNFDQIGDRILSWVPNILAAIVILIIGYFIAKSIAALIHSLLKKMRLNDRIEASTGGFLKKISANPAKLIADIVYWLIWVLVWTIAIPVLNVPVLNELILGFYSYLPNILAALLILIVAGSASVLIASTVGKLIGDTTTGKIIVAAVPALTMTIATFMVLVQLKIATEIVVITYAGIWGALALGFALAFGLGGRDAASRLIETVYQKSKEKAGAVREDLEKGKRRVEGHLDEE
jgi:flagellar biosynthesis protein FliQ